MEIKNTYLMWIGASDYKSIEDWSDEALTQGISKRLPNEHVAKAMMEEGTVVFVAHDEGEYKECPECFGTIENPERRKLEQEKARVGKEVNELGEEAKALQQRYADGIILKEELEPQLARIEKLLENRRKKINKLADQINALETWAEGGTGGKVVLLQDGLKKSIWDYRKYNYWLHQPGKFNADDVVDKEMCECCGGTGRLPEGKVFGMFIPGDFEYIVPEEAKEAVAEKMREMGLTTVTEAAVKLEKKRKCGYRKPGGVYVVTKTEGADETSTKSAVAALVAEGKLDASGVEVNGQFAHFMSPVPIEAKRFRGIKRWSLDPAVEDEAEMIAEAV